VPDWLSIHEPLLVNTIGHSAGAVIFGMLLYFFVLNSWRAREQRSILPAVAAALAMLWNLGSLVGMAAGPEGSMAADIIVAASFSVLSLLPAVLLHISLQARHRSLWIAGYVLSLIAVALHIVDLLTQAPRFHYAALLIVTIGFTVLTAISVMFELQRKNKAAVPRLIGAMGLFLFAISFVHFSSEKPGGAWSREIALHHAGLPLALLVLLQDYRFLLLDAFLRFVVNASLAAGAVLIAIRLAQSPQLTTLNQRPFEAGLLFVGACAALTFFVYLRNRTQAFLSRVLFLRSNVNDALLELQQLGRTGIGESEYLNAATDKIAAFLRASRFQTTDKYPAELAGPISVVDPGNSGIPAWVQAVLPLRLSRGDAVFLLLGAREGGRRYLSEDFSVLARLGAAVVEHVEQLRAVEMENLVSQAELKALQAQINPHFLFNSLNTLYGTIDRDNAEARRMVLNLADVFRYLLRSDRTLIAVEEELKIVRAYLEIEELRLGPKLRTELRIDAEALHTMIPLLSIQPLVENAVKHGIAAKMGDGFVRLTIRACESSLMIEIENSGECDQRVLDAPAEGIGLSNVRRRLDLYYGAGARFRATAQQGVTTIGFTIPLGMSSLPARPLAASLSSFT
jgi:two-component system LytT family sensor kinase